MNENTKLLYCLFGSAILALLNNPILESSRFGIFENLYGISGAILFQIMNILTNILSLFGFILLIVFSIILIKRNVFQKK
jgi:hypothetical protein